MTPSQFKETERQCTEPPGAWGSSEAGNPTTETLPSPPTAGLVGGQCSW